MKRLLLISLLFIILFFVSGCSQKITNFDECIAAGHPAMESYPRQCSDGKNTFAEVIDVEPILTKAQAYGLAQSSECAIEANLLNEYSYNEFTKTWWIELDLEKPGCNPACVVNEETKTAEINWRCTGLIE